MSVVFQENFLALPTKHQEIWKVIHYFCRTYHNSFPSHAKIAQLVGCCRRTVVNAINNFRNFGWLETAKRCFRSCMFYVKEHLLRMNPKDKRNFMKSNKDYGGGEGGGGSPGFREELHSNLHTIYGNPRNTETLSDSKHPTKKKYWHPNRVIPDFLKKYPKALPPEEQQKLINQFSEAHLVEALKDALSFDKHVAKIRCLPAFLTLKCKQYQEKESVWNEAEDHQEKTKAKSKQEMPSSVV